MLKKDLQELSSFDNYRIYIRKIGINYMIEMQKIDMKQYPEMPNYAREEDKNLRKAVKKLNSRMEDIWFNNMIGSS